jgi:hypothetical protein
MQYQLIEEKSKTIIECLEKHNKDDLLWGFKNRESLNDLEFDLMLDNAWKHAFKEALSDNDLSVEEHAELMKIQNLTLELKTPGYRDMLKYKLDNSYKNIFEINSQNKKKSILEPPKPKPKFDDSKEKN